MAKNILFDRKDKTVSSGIAPRRKSALSNRKLRLFVLFRNITLVLWAGLSFSTLIVGQANAANVPNFDKPVDFNVREQNINDFLYALFQEIDVPVSINSELEGNVNGKFKDTARNVFNEISNAFSLTVYYDGAVAQTYRKNEIERKLLPATAGESKRVLSIANSMNLPDSRNTINIEDGGVVVSGTDKFISQVDEIITSAKKTRPKAAKIKPAPVVEKVISFPEESPIVYQLFKLKHAWAIDTKLPVGGQTVVIPGVATILNDLIQGNGVEGPSGISGQSNVLSGLKGQGMNKQGLSQSDPSNSITDSLNTKEQSGHLPRIVADSRLNAIVIRDSEDKMPAYLRLINSLDVESGMVEIEATIIDINTDMTRDLGVNWRYQDSDADVLFGNGTNADQSLIPGSGLITPQGQGGILSFSLGEPANFLARIRLLEQKGAAKVISKPHVITLSDVEAVLAATTEFFVRVAGDQEVDLFNVPVGTTLRVTPHIFNDDNQNKIKLLVNIEDGSQSPNAQVDNIPVIERANISTQAVINEGDSLLVGGLVRESYRNSGYQVPVLGRIPLLGGLFRSKQKQATRVERLFMITPRLAGGIGFSGSKNNSALSGDHSQIVRDSANRIVIGDYGDRPGMNYWSEESRTQQALEAKTRRANQTSTIEDQTKNSSDSVAGTPVPVKPKEQYGSEEVIYAIIENNVFISPFQVKEWPIRE